MTQVSRLKSQYHRQSMINRALTVHVHVHVHVHVLLVEDEEEDAALAAAFVEAAGALRPIQSK